VDFAYEAVAPSGRTFRGVEAASSEAALERTLRDRGLFPVAIVAGGKRRAGVPRVGRRRATVEAVRYLATLVGAGFPLDRALDTAARLSGNSVVSEAFQEIGESVRGGMTLARAMAAHPRVHSALALGMVEAGERGGQLGEALSQLADHLEREEGLRGQVASSLVYPMLMACVGGAAIAVLTFFVLPRFVVLLQDAGAALPTSTALLMAASAFLTRNWVVLALSTVGVVGAAMAYRGLPSGRAVTDRLFARLPVIGPIRRNLAAARLGRTLEGLLGAGLPLVQALDVAAGTLTDAGAAQDVAKAREDVVTGSNLASALGHSAAFPYLFLQMVALGEESGRLQEMLGRGANAAEDQLERSLTRMVRLVEPTLIVVFGVVAGFVALSLLQAIYGMRIEGLTP